jgi:hypothetical protein
METRTEVSGECDSEMRSNESTAAAVYLAGLTRKNILEVALYCEKGKNSRDESIENPVAQMLIGRASIPSRS